MFAILMASLLAPLERHEFTEPHMGTRFRMVMYAPDKASASKAAKAASEAGIGVKELASKLGTDPRELRRFLRSRDEGVGFGRRYSFTPAQVKKLTEAWEQAQGE